MEHPPNPLRKGGDFSVTGWQTGGKTPATPYSLMHNLLPSGDRSARSYGQTLGITSPYGGWHASCGFLPSSWQHPSHGGR